MLVRSVERRLQVPKKLSGLSKAASFHATRPVGQSTGTEEDALMTQPLDPRFAKTVALMRSSTFLGEKGNARKSAEAIAQSCGRTFAQALAELESPLQVVRVGRSPNIWRRRSPGGRMELV